MSKNRWLNEPLVRCATIEASCVIQEIATVLQDEHFQLVVQGGNLIAMDVAYHKT